MKAQQGFLFQKQPQATHATRVLPAALLVKSEADPCAQDLRAYTKSNFAELLHPSVVGHADTGGGASPGAQTNQPRSELSFIKKISEPSRLLSALPLPRMFSDEAESHGNPSQHGLQSTAAFVDHRTFRAHVEHLGAKLHDAFAPGGVSLAALIADQRQSWSVDFDWLARWRYTWQELFAGRPCSPRRSLTLEQLQRARFGLQYLGDRALMSEQEVIMLLSTFGFLGMWGEFCTAFSIRSWPQVSALNLSSDALALLGAPVINAPLQASKMTTGFAPLSSPLFCTTQAPRVPAPSVAFSALFGRPSAPGGRGGGAVATQQSHKGGPTYSPWSLAS